MLPNIYVLSYIPSVGELGGKTKTISNKICEICGKDDEKFEVISYWFEQWNGEDLIKAGGLNYFVSERLKLLLEVKIEGINFQKAVIEKADYYKPSKKAYQKEIPSFYLLNIGNILDGPDIWWERDNVCQACSRQKWKITLIGIQSTVNSDPTATYVPRQVFKNKWNGEDIFCLEDPGLPIVTQNFLDIVNSLNGFKYELKTANWV